MPSHSLWRHRNVIKGICLNSIHQCDEPAGKLVGLSLPIISYQYWGWIFYNLWSVWWDVLCDLSTILNYFISWWHHQMETFSSLLALCERNSPVTGEFPSQRPVAQSFEVFFDLLQNKGMCKESRRRWFEMPLRSLRCHCNKVPLWICIAKPCLKSSITMETMVEFYSQLCFCWWQSTIWSTSLQWECEMWRNVS